MIVTLMPSDPAARVVFGRPDPKLSGPYAPRPSRGGHGTHTASSAAGSAMSNDGGSVLAAGWYNSVAAESRLAVVDLLAGDGPYIYPPLNLGAALIERLHNEAGAQVFLAAWGCENGDLSTNGDGSCKEYSTGAWELDQYASMNPGLVIVVPAGETDNDGNGMISGIASCRNCITVGASQAWPPALIDAAQVATECLPDDCPDVSGDEGDPGACGSMASTLPQRIPWCCWRKYNAANGYGCSTVHWSSKLGRGSMLLSKPDLVAPGLDVVCDAF